MFISWFIQFRIGFEILKKFAEHILLNRNSNDKRFQSWPLAVRGTRRNLCLENFLVEGSIVDIVGSESENNLTVIQFILHRVSERTKTFSGSSFSGI